MEDPMNISLKLLTTVLAVFLFVVPQNASAAIGTCVGTISIFAEQAVTSTAHLVSLHNTSCTDACTGSRLAYIDFNDKQLYAMALSATFAGSTVGVMYDTSSGASKGSSSSEHNALVTCRVLNIWK